MYDGPLAGIVILAIAVTLFALGIGPFVVWLLG